MKKERLSADERTIFFGNFDQARYTLSTAHGTRYTHTHAQQTELIKKNGVPTGSSSFLT